MIIDEEAYLKHYGILRKSGRYPWGSGNSQSTRNKDFLGYVDDMRKQGLSEVEIARGQGLSVTQLRAAKTIASNQQKQERINTAEKLAAKGLSNIAIGEKMGINESSVRSLRAPGAADRARVLTATADMLREQVAEKRFVDVGKGVENTLGISNEKLKAAVAILKEEGYRVHYGSVRQLGTGKDTSQKILAAPGVTPKEVFANRDNIRQIEEHSDDGGRNFYGNVPPINISSKRIGINYADQGGKDADGVIYVRPGVKDVELGKSAYAQVRVAVDGTHYLKGMAMYKDDLPKGVDLVFNTNKSNTGNKLDAMKEQSKDPDNPFGAAYRQLKQLDEHGNPINGTVRSAMNLVNDQGDWDNWSRRLSTQFLSKQSPTLAKQQLDMTYEKNKNNLDTILSLTNPAVRKKLLDDFADNADSSAVHLKAAALPRQAARVILPINSLKDTEIYAPGFKNGEQVVLVRHPHAGTFEIPELTVNNKNQEGQRLIGVKLDTDAIGINAKVAARLSGADFDGDAVLVIPNNNRQVKTTAALEGLKNFDPQHSYPAYEGMPRMTPRQKGAEMGKVSNLIADMTIRKASTEDLARAVRHSMVVIDAEKHNLDYKASARDNGIAQLSEKYQGKKSGGASTLITLARSDIRVDARKARPAALGGGVDKATGKKEFVPTGESFVGRDGKLVVKKLKTTRLAETEDAHTLSSGTIMENTYASHSNRMKDLANAARKASVNTKSIPYSPSANKHYHTEVAELKSALNIAEKNAPRERQAQVLANAVLRAKKEANPDMEASEAKKIGAQALAEARTRTGAGKERIEITEAQWAAIQAGAISDHQLTRILVHANIETVKKLATPRENIVMTPIKQARAKAMIASGYPQSEVADALGVALSTLKSNLSEGGKNE